MTSYGGEKEAERLRRIHNVDNPITRPAAPDEDFNDLLSDPDRTMDRVREWNRLTEKPID